MGTADWRWVNESGEQFQVTDDELIGGLSSEAIPAYALVWRPGWAEWIAAMHVAELSWALPAGAAGPPVRPREGFTSTVPAPPLGRYSTLRAEAGARRQASDPPYFDPPITSIPPTQGVRNATDSYHDDDWEPLTQIHDTEGAHAMEEMASGAGFEDADEVTRARFAADMASLSKPSMTPPLLSVPPARPSLQVITVEHPAVAPPPPSEPTHSTRIPRAPTAPAGMRPMGEVHSVLPRYDTSLPPPRRRRSVLALGGIACGLAAAVVTLFFRGGFAASFRESVRSILAEEPPPAVAPSVSVAPPAPPPPKPRTLECHVVAGPKELAPWAHGSIPVELVQHGDEIAVAYAQAPHYAMGITVHPKTLSVKRLHREYRKQQLFSVRPLLAYGKLAFSAQRHGDRLAFAQTVDTEPPFAVGRSQQGMAVLHQGLTTEVVWPLSGTQDAGLPSIAPTKDGFALAVRLGGPEGTVNLGYMSKVGKAKSPLFELAKDQERVSIRPSLAASGNTLALAYAARPKSSKEFRRVWLSRAEAGKAPSKPIALDLTEADAQREVSHVRVSAAGDEGFTLQWTSGVEAEQSVRVQRLDSNLAPMGPARPVGATVGYSYAGASWSDGKRVLSVFVQNDAGEDQLWGSSLECK